MDSLIDIRQKSKVDIVFEDNLTNKWWRLNNLYWIIDKKGQRVPFRCNREQTRLYDDMWYLNIILKARQFGGTTFVDIYFLDECLFNPNVEAGIIAHNKDDAKKIFRRKVKFPYDNLPDRIKDKVQLTTDSQAELAFSNGSIIYVGTSMRSGTLQYLHISEHGKICKKYPEKAEEIRTGSLNAVDIGQIIFIESTAEGAVGDFHQFCTKAMALEKSGAELTELDFKFHFFPWFWNPEYTMNPKGVIISEDDETYFNTIERTCDTVISPGQRAWYVKKRESQGSFMKQEYPSTPKEAFESRFDGFDFYEDHHVLKNPPMVPEHAPLYMTFDWGFGRPFSIGYWWVDADGRLYRFGEIYGCKDPDNYPDVGLRQTDQQICELIIAKEEELGITGRDIDRLCDPTCFNKKPNFLGGGQGIPTSEVFSKYGLYLRPGDANRALKIRQMHSRLQLQKDSPPMMLIYEECTQFIRTIPLLHADKNKPEDIDKKLEDHCYDEAALICMARPISMELPDKYKSSYDKRIDALKAGTADDFETQQIRSTMNDPSDWDDAQSSDLGDLEYFDDGDRAHDPDVVGTM